MNYWQKRETRLCPTCGFIMTYYDRLGYRFAGWSCHMSWKHYTRAIDFPLRPYIPYNQKIPYNPNALKTISLHTWRWCMLSNKNPDVTSWMGEYSGV